MKAPRGADTSAHNMFAAEMICSLKDAMHKANVPWQPSAQVALELVWVAGGQDADAHSTEYWISGCTYDSQIWMLKCDIEERPSYTM